MPSIPEAAPRTGFGSWPQCVAKKPWGLSMNLRKTSLLMSGQKSRKQSIALMFAANRGDGLEARRERRFRDRPYVSDPGKSYLWSVGVESRLGSRRWSLAHFR